MRTLLFGGAVAALALLGGCAASYDQAEKSAPAPAAAAPAPVKETPVPAPAKSDTVSVAVQQAQKPAYESTVPVTTAPVPPAAARYCVQIGAYKLAENAEVVAATAKARFARNVATLRDDATGLTKVMVGDFATKEEARTFRDRMVQQFPGDYKDAWVSELSR